jgi:hypothetical protein
MLSNPCRQKSNPHHTCISSTPLCSTYEGGPCRATTYGISGKVVSNSHFACRLSCRPLLGRSRIPAAAPPGFAARSVSAAAGPAAWRPPPFAAAAPLPMNPAVLGSAASRLARVLKDVPTYEPPGDPPTFSPCLVCARLTRIQRELGSEHFPGLPHHIVPCELEKFVHLHLFQVPQC